MILEVSEGSSWVVRGAAALVLIVHISGAGVGLLSGTAALVFRKGGRPHRVAGIVFFVSMLTMCAIGGPAAVRGSAILFVPEIAVLAVLIFWLVRVRFTRRIKDGAGVA
jgi:hypothetical protein